MAKVRVGQYVRVQGHTAAWYGWVAKVHQGTVTMNARGGGIVRGVKIADLLPWHIGFNAAYPSDEACRQAENAAGA